MLNASKPNSFLIKMIFILFENQQIRKKESKNIAICIDMYLELSSLVKFVSQKVAPHIKTIVVKKVNFPNLPRKHFSNDLLLFISIIIYSIV